MYRNWHSKQGSRLCSEVIGNEPREEEVVSMTTRVSGHLSHLQISNQVLYAGIKSRLNITNVLTLQMIS